jgi:peptidoglycan/LPS O-acetylase OafA/YrhL
MFGALRLLLALMVMANHVLRIEHIGQFAVFGFYALSGYLMTFVVLNSYGLDGRGFRRFWYNRFLRLFPSYWFSLLLSILLISFTGVEYVTRFNGSMRLPNTPGDWLANIFMAFWAMNPAEVMPRLNGPTWAITVELIFYFAISLGISKNFKGVLVWFYISAAYHMASIMLGWGYESRYFPLAAASLPFSAGALIYHLKDRESVVVNLIVNNRYLILIGYLWSILLYLVLLSQFELLRVGPLANSLLTFEFYCSFALIWCYLFACAKNRSGFPWLSGKHDALLGAFSYPVYLLHYQAWILGSYILANQTGKIILGGVFLLLVLMCWVAVYVIEKPVERLRNRVRSSADYSMPIGYSSPEI